MWTCASTFVPGTLREPGIELEYIEYPLGGRKKHE